MEYQLRFIDLMIKGAGFSLLVLGWLLTSNDARAFLAASGPARLALVAGLAVIAAAEILLAIRLMQVLRHLHRELVALDYFPRAYYEFRALSPRVAVAVATLNIAPLFVAVALILFGLR